MKRRDLDDLLHEELRRPSPVPPDLTRNIMGRLGYMKVTPAVARRRRVQRWSARFALIAMSLAVGYVGVVAFKASPDARIPHEITIPAAISSDVNQKQHRINSVIQILRELPPRLELDSTSPPDGQPVPPEPDWPHLFDDDVDRSAVGPMRWA